MWTRLYFTNRLHIGEQTLDEAILLRHTHDLAGGSLWTCPKAHIHAPGVLTGDLCNTKTLLVLAVYYRASVVNPMVEDIDAHGRGLGNGVHAGTKLEEQADKGHAHLPHPVRASACG